MLKYEHVCSCDVPDTVTVKYVRDKSDYKVLLKNC